MSVVPDPRRARLRVGVGAAVVVVLLGLGCAVFVTAITPHGSTSVAMPTSGPSASSSPGSSGRAIYVHILGQVVRPGLYALRDGDRAVDAVAAAGGFTPDADQAGLNLARFVDDGEQIVVPAVGQAPLADGTPGGGAGAPAGKVNINTADEPTLETLPRVGPAMAQKIIAWRETNGRFASVEDLMSVSGIGEKTFDGLKDLVTV
ncbi:MAG TPA: helix-hairpin-helix domain-containing protein [Pseudolysinimonas sp.]|nr:helix-hairpin-helix domain-containing protein [Pseudolysinimonas sp.]